MGKWTPTPLKEENNSAADSIKLKGSSADTLSMMDLFIPETPSSSLDNLILSDYVNNQIQLALNRIRYHEILYEEWSLKKIDPAGKKLAINFYGPSGTGKTCCAEGLANYFQLQLINVKYSELVSKYVGDTNKAISAAFSKAKATNSILFFDEAEAILGARLSQVNQSADEGVNVSRITMLLELDRFEGIVLFATNFAENIDSAFVRRILAHIEFELPDFDCRVKLWDKIFIPEIPRELDINSEWLAEESDFLTGGDILNVVKLASCSAIARQGENRLVKKSDLLGALNQVKKSKANVGKKVNRSHTREYEEIVDYQSLPNDVKKSYDVAIKQTELS